MAAKKSRTYFGSLDDGEKEDAPLMGQQASTSPDNGSSILLRTITFGFAASLVVFALTFLPANNEAKASTSKAVAVPAKSTLPKHRSFGVKKKSTNSLPNFVFLLIDDMGYGTMGYEDSDISFASPFLSTLAQNGVMLTNYYSQEICSPARAALMTGRYPITLGFQYEELAPDVEWGLNTSEVIFPELLKEAGYKNYMVGKWNLGHYTPEYLPTARGFDQFVGFMSGQVYHWSKVQPEKGKYIDFMHSDSDCYEPYSETDKNLYSTFFYRDRALDVIENHDFSDPMFLYLAVQAVHDPFSDNTTYPDGIPKTYFADGVYDDFADKVVGLNRLQYALSLRLLDEAVVEIVKSLQERDQWDNTYLIVASDNGGCYQAGGRNGNLRGCKGSLYEGGLKVDAFVYSELLPKSAQGTQYDGLMHVSDWFSTLLNFAGLEYTPDAGHPLDGYDQRDAMLGHADEPRDTLLYNLYYNVDEKRFALNKNAVFAIRKGNYKLLHTYTNTDQAMWYNFSVPLDDDFNMLSGSCPQMLALRGNFEKMLFDLENDPNETTNLYGDSSLATVQAELYELLYEFAAKTAEDVCPSSADENSYTMFAENGNYIVPWVEPADKTRSYPTLCKPSTLFSISTGWYM